MLTMARGGGKKVCNSKHISSSQHIEILASERERESVCLSIHKRGGRGWVESWYTPRWCLLEHLEGG